MCFLENISLGKLEAQGSCTGHRSIIAMLYRFSFKYMKREKGRDLTQYTNLCGLNTLQKSIEIALKYTKMTKSKKMSKTRPNETKNNNTSSQMLLDHCYAFSMLL